MKEATLTINERASGKKKKVFPYLPIFEFLSVWNVGNWNIQAFS